jgi:hypothetical protein
MIDRLVNVEEYAYWTSFIMDESVDSYGSHLNGLKALLQMEQRNTRKQYACSKKSLFKSLPQMQTVSHLFKYRFTFLSI